MTGTIGWVELREKFRGALVGAAVGDALGARFEGMASVGQADLGRLTEEPGPLRYTDDTHMTLGMAESLVERKGFDGHHMAGLFARNFKAEPWRGYGPGPPQVFHLLGQGEPWDEASRGLFGGRGSFGNGGAMRVAPAALFAFDDMEAVESLSRKTALITHSHELGIEGAALQACAIALALQRSVATGGIDPAAFVNELRAYVRAPEYLKKLERVGQLLALGGPSHRGEVVAQLGNGIEAFESVPTAICAFLGTPDSFAGVVTYAISLGGDTDTIACMAGAIAGAYLGLESIPVQWRTRVEDSARLQELADSLLALAQATE